MKLHLRPQLSHNMEGPGISSRNKNAAGNNAPQDAALLDAAPQETAAQSGGESATKLQEGNSGTDLRPLNIQRSESGNLPASLGVPSTMQNNFQEDTPMTGTSPDPAADSLNYQTPTEPTKEQKLYYVDERHFVSAFTSVPSVKKTHEAKGWDTTIRLRGRTTYRLKKYYGIYWLEKSKHKLSECQGRFEDDKEKAKLEFEGVNALAIEYKPDLWQHRFDMDYFFNKKKLEEEQKWGPADAMGYAS